MQIQANTGSLAQQLIQQQASQQQQKTDEKPNPSRQIIEQAQAAEKLSPLAAIEQQLDTLKNPQQSVLITPIEKRTTTDSITQRFEAKFEEQVQKGRNVDIRV